MNEYTYLISIYVKFTMVKTSQREKDQRKKNSFKPKKDEKDLKKEWKLNKHLIVGI